MDRLNHDTDAAAQLEKAKELLFQFLVAHRMVDRSYIALDRADDDIKAFLGVGEQEIGDYIRQNIYKGYKP